MTKIILVDIYNKNCANRNFTVSIKKEKIMADFKIDGKYLYGKSTKMGEYDGVKVFRDASGRKVGEVSGTYILDDRGRKLVELKGTDVYEYSGGRKVTTINDLRKLIDGTGGMSLVGFWALLIR